MWLGQGSVKDVSSGRLFDVHWAGALVPPRVSQSCGTMDATLGCTSRMAIAPLGRHQDIRSDHFPAGIGRGMVRIAFSCRCGFSSVVGMADRAGIPAVGVEKSGRPEFGRPLGPELPL